MSKQTIDTNAFNSALRERLAKHRHVQLLAHADDFIELMGLHLIKNIKTLDRNGQDEFIFLDFWRISWEGDTQYIADTTIRAVNAKPSTARNVSAYFDKAGEITPKVEEFFFSVFSRPPQYMTYINELVSLATQKDNDFLPEAFHVGKNVAFLFWAVMTEIFQQTYQHEATVCLSGLGDFSRGLKIQRKSTKPPTHKGYLQFTPNII
jgi:hypothetical protein